MKKSTMKKLGSMILACLMVVSAFATFSTVTYAENDSYKTKIHETYLELDLEELAALTADPTTYDISVFIEFVSSAEELAALYSDDPVEQREKGKNYHSNKNKKLKEALELENAYISKYAPFAEIRYDSIEEYEANWKQIRSIAKNKSVKDVDVSLDVKERSTERDTGLSANVYPISDILSDIGISNNTYTGEDVVVGVLEPGVPNSTEHLVEGNYFFYGETETTHATWVTSMLMEIAEDVILSCVATDNYTFLEAMEILLDDGAEVINMSASSTGVDYYDNRTAYIDYTSYLYQYLLVTAAGDGASMFGGAPGIESPGLSYNAITVGAMNEGWKVSYLSSYDNGLVDIFKVDLVAPGERLDVDWAPSGSLTGTSFAAPIVSGIAARLIQEFYVLSRNPGLLKAVLIQSCEKLDGQYGEHSCYAGAGLVNYTNARQILINNQYCSAIKNRGASDGSYLAYALITIPANSTVHIYLHSMIEAPYTTSTNHAAVDMSQSTYTVFLQRENTFVGEFETSLTPYITFRNTTTASQIYTLTLYLDSNLVDGKENIYIAYDFSPNS